MFGMSMAVQMRNKKQPALWWESYGAACPELQKLAIRILSQTCSATGCERNWSVFDQVHTKRRNRLEQKRLNALVFTKYNLRLEARHQKRVKDGEFYDPISLSDMESDDEWITEREDPTLPDNTDWLDINECFQLENSESSKRKKRGPRDINKKGKEKAIEEEEQEEEVALEQLNEVNFSEENVENEELLDLNDDTTFYFSD